MERVKGIEPSYEAWEAAVLPLNYTREDRHYRHACARFLRQRASWFGEGGYRPAGHWLLSATGLPFLKVLTTVGAFRRLPLSS